jgi:hypothetical protein
MPVRYTMTQGGSVPHVFLAGTCGMCRIDVEWASGVWASIVPAERAEPTLRTSRNGRT